MEDDENIFAYLRTLGDEKILVILNFSDKETIFNMPGQIQHKDFVLLLSNYKVDTIGIEMINLRLYEARVYKLY